MVKRLIINADDFGLSKEANHRIVECLIRGSVTDISILASGRHFDHAVKLARANRLNKIGLHLTLTGQFKPVKDLKDVPSLIGKNNYFSKNHRSFLLRYFFGRVRTDEIYKEWKAQALKVKDAGLRITHIDGHEHIHMVPAILRIAVRLMKEEGIGYIRFPQEVINLASKLKSPRSFFRNALLSYMCSVSRRFLRDSNIKHNDDFIGHAKALRIKKKEFVSLISNLKDGLTEFCCHPGTQEEEAEALCDRSLKNEFRKHSVELVSY